MTRLLTVIFFALLAVPFVPGWYISAKLHPYRRDRHPVLGTLRVLRPDQYTDEGQPWLRRLWLVYALALPWFLLIVFVFGKLVFGKGE